MSVTPAITQPSTPQVVHPPVSYCSRKAKILAGLGLLAISAIPLRGKVSGERFNLIKDVLGHPREDLTTCKFASTLSKIEIHCPNAHYTSEWCLLFPIRETVQFTSLEGQSTDRIPSLEGYEGSLTTDKSGEGTYFYKDGSLGRVHWQETDKGVSAQVKGAHFFQTESGLSQWKYIGEMENGSLQGKGALFALPSYSEIYAGQWRAGKKNGVGSGSYGFGNEKMENYHGDWEDDMPHGQGTQFDKTGNRLYTGGFVHGVRHGVGTGSYRPTYNTGDVVRYINNGVHRTYSSIYMEHHDFAFGTVFNYNYKPMDIIERYEGEWQNGKPHGVGKQFKDGILIFSGEFRHGRRHGKGTEFYPNGKEKFTGDWQEGLKHGNGRAYDETGHRTYIGVWHEDKHPDPYHYLSESWRHQENVWGIWNGGKGALYCLMSGTSYRPLEVAPSEEELINYIGSRMAKSNVRRAREAFITIYGKEEGEALCKRFALL